MNKLHPALAAALIVTGTLAVPLAAQAASITLTTTVRDFSAAHDDFENAVGGGGFVTGLVGSTLGVDGKPVYVGGQTLSTAANFNQWYNDVPGVNVTLSKSLTANETAPGSGVDRQINPHNLRRWQVPFGG